MAAVTNDYQLLDSGNMKKLERLGPYLLVRPSLAAVWEPRLPRNRVAQGRRRLYARYGRRRRQVDVLPQGAARV